MKPSQLAGLLLAAVCGCSGGGIMPSGPHRIDQASLRGIVSRASTGTGVPAPLISAVITVESHGDPSAISTAGAGGLMQLMPATAARYGVADRFEPEANVDAGARYLHDLLVRYHNDMSLALAAYNAGPGAVDAAHGVPAYPETRAYVARVTAALHDR
ncbi:MAG: lytic transglycosylase domain-containing protein [Vulcanimicrobiaceae bacterium]